VYQRAAGAADREAQRPMTVDTIFRYSSLTKAIVSATALKLIESGQLGLEDPVTIDTCPNIS
jgi:CubicO group peptidase (beta-lactamase class C family)